MKLGKLKRNQHCGLTEFDQNLPIEGDVGRKLNRQYVQVQNFISSCNGIRTYKCLPSSKERKETFTSKELE